MTQNNNQINKIPSTLLKFKSLDENSLDRIKDIITDKQIWCSKLWRLNDAMEGVYKLSKNDFDTLDKIYSQKNKYYICSFTHPDSFDSPLFWGYYANGLKGIAIEIELTAEDKKHFKKVKYVKESPNLENIQHNEDIDHIPNNDNIDNEVIKIITTKLKFWKRESEYRYIIKKDTNENVYCDVNIKKIYIGWPYRNTANCDQITNGSNSLIDYHKCRNELECFCKENDIPFEHIPKGLTFP